MTSPQSRPHLGFARKYRPQTFDDVVGQEAVSVTLKNALLQKNNAQAYLFFGPRGVGKTTTARILAKALNCKKGPTPEPCGACDPCQEIAKSASIDVLELDAATHTQVDRIREMIIETVSLAPSRDRFKVFIIDEVHMLSTASFNALLKTLEEPPPHVVFILATTDPQKIPPTIVSRCQRFRFRPVPLELLVRHLSWIAKQEKIAANPASLELLARSAGGALRDAIGLLEQAHAYAEGEITEARVRELLGSFPEAILLDLARAILEREAPSAAKVLERVWEEGGDAGQLARDLRDRLHELYLHRLGVGRDPGPEWAVLAAPHPPEAFGYLVGRLNKVLEGLRGADSQRLILELGIYGMLEAAQDLRGWIARLEALERRLGGGAPVPAPVVEDDRPAPARPVSTPDRVDSESVSTEPEGAMPAPMARRSGAPPAGHDKTWVIVLDRIYKEKPGLAEDLRGVQLVAGSPGEWRLVFRRAFDLERARLNQKLIEAEMATAFGSAVRLKFEVGGEAEGRPAPEAAAQERAHDDPGVRKVLEVFPGKVRHVKKK